MRTIPKFLCLPLPALAASLLISHMAIQERPARAQNPQITPYIVPPVRMGGIAYAPDGRTVACLDGINSQMTSLDLRDSATGEILRTIPAPSPTLHWLAYLPNGRLFVAGAGSEGNSALWEVRGGGAQGVALPPTNGFGSILGLSPDGHTIAVVTNEEVRLADIATGKSRSFPTPRVGSPSEMAFAPNGRTLAVAGSVGISLWDLDTGGLRRRISGMPWLVQTLAFSPDGRTLIYTLNNGSSGVFRVDSATGRLLPPLVGHRSVVPDVLFTGDGKEIVSCGWDDKTVRVWDARSGRLQRVLPGPLPRTTQEKDRLTGRVLGETVHVSPPITALALSPDGRTVAGADGGGMLRWDLVSGQPRDMPVPPPGHVKGAALSADGKSLFSIHLNGVLVRRSLLNGFQTHIALPSPLSSEAVAVSPNGKTVATAGGDAVLLWNSALTRQAGALPLHDSTDPVLAFSPDNQAVAVTVRDGVQLWDVASSVLIRTFSSGPRVVKSIAFAPGGRTLAAIDAAGGIVLWDVESRKALWQRQAHSGSGWAIAFSPDGRLLASGGGDGVVRLWQSADGAAAGPPFQFSLVRDGFTNRLRADEVLSVAFSRDGKGLAAVAGYGQLKVWDIDSRREVRSLQLNEGGSTHLAFLPDRHTLLVAGYGGLQLFDLQTGLPRSLFTASGVF